MAIKDLNELKPNKVTGNKLYADEWNTIVDALQKHIKDAEIHLPITIDEENNTLSYREGGKIYTYILNKKTGEHWGQLLVNYVKDTDNNIIQKDNNDKYKISNISAESPESIILYVQFKQQKYIDETPLDEYRSVEADIRLSETQGFNVSVSDTETDTIKQLTISNIPNNNSYTNPATYTFNVEGYIGDGAYDTATLSFELTQNAKNATYSNPQLEVELNSKLSTAIDTGNKLKSAGGELVFNVTCTQQYGGETLTITDGITATVTDNHGNTLNSSYSEGKITIIIPRNDYTTDISYSTFEINATAHEKSATPWEPESPYTQNKVIITYSNPNTITLSYDDYPQAGSSTGILPSYSFKVDKNYNNGKSLELNISFNQLSTIPTGIQLTFNKVSGSATVTSSTGKVVTTSSNSNYLSIELAKIELTVVAGEDSETSQKATVMQSGLTTPDLIYGGISIGGNDGVFAYTVQTLPNLLSELLLDGNSFIKLDNNSTPKYLINTDIQNTINLLTLDDDMVVVYLLKDTTKNISVYDSTAEGYYLIPGTTDPIPYNPSFVISNGTYNYKGTTYKLIMIPTENKSLNYLIKIL